MLRPLPSVCPRPCREEGVRWSDTAKAAAVRCLMSGDFPLRLMRHCYGRTGQMASAEDAFQQGFVHALKGLDSYVAPGASDEEKALKAPHAARAESEEGACPLRGWFWQVTSRAARAPLRRRDPLRGATDVDERLPELSPNPFQLLFRKSQRAALESLLASLSDRDRRLLAGSLEDEPDAVVARELAITEVNVRQRRWHLLRALRARLEAEGHDGTSDR